MNPSAFSTSFISAAVEFFEIAAIAYAMASSGFHREAVSGTITGLAGVLVVSIFSWPWLEKVPVHIFQLGVGLLLAFVGGSWLLKSIKRQLRHQRARWISDPLAECGDVELQPSGFSLFNAFLMAKSAAMEGTEAAIILVSIGVASRAWKEAILGGCAAFATTLAIVMLLHGHLKKLPETFIKLGAGVVLFCLGIFWIFEGLQGR